MKFEKGIVRAESSP